MSPDAGVLAQVVADTTEDCRKRVVKAGDADRLAEVTRSHGPHVPGDLLVDRALVEAGGGDAVEGAKLARRLRAVGPERLLPVAPIVTDLVGVAPEVEPRTVADG